MAEVHQTGERIAYHRKRLGLSQVELAALIGRSESWVSQVERGVRAVDRMSVLQKVADALSVPVAELRGASANGVASIERPEALEALRLVLTGHPAISAVLERGQQTIPAERIAQLRERHAPIWAMVHASRYNDLAPIVAELIPDLEQASRAAINKDAVVARELLTDTYQAVAAMLAKLGEGDAAWVAADRATYTAEALPDPLAAAASLFRMAHVFLSTGQIAQTQAVANLATQALDDRTAKRPTPETLSLLGAFHLVLAIAAARDDDRNQAYEHLIRPSRLLAESATTATTTAPNSALQTCNYMPLA